MSHQTRRTFLKCSGAVLGGVFAGSTVVAAERTDRFIVRTGGTAAPSDLSVVHDLPGIEYAVVEGSESAVEASSAVRAYEADVEVSRTEPIASRTGDETTPADEPFYSFQWDKQSQDIPAAHDVTTGEGTRVAIIDSGVDAAHPDLEVNEALSRNFTDDGLGAANPAGGFHGTHVGGIVGASDNGTGVVGTAPGTDLVDCRVFSLGGGASFADVVAAMLYSAEIGADAANLSLGAYPVARQAQGAFYGGVLNSAMTYVNRQGTLLCIAAGNDAADLQHDIGEEIDIDGDGELETLEGGAWISLPNEGAQACSVAATGPVGFANVLFAGGEFDSPPESPATYTNYGTNAITVAAPGGDFDQSLDDIVGGVPAWAYDLVFNTVSDPVFDDDGNLVGSAPAYGWVAGTSMAAPQVAGAAALVKSVNPDYGADQVEAALKRTASVPEGEDKAFYGAGLIDPVAALDG